MMASTIQPQFTLKTPLTPLNPSFQVFSSPTKPRRRKPFFYLDSSIHFCTFSSKCFSTFNPYFSSSRTVLTRVFSDDYFGTTGASSRQRRQKSDNVRQTNHNFCSTGDHSVGLFVRMLGLDNDPLDREQAIVALWKHSLGGKKCIDGIMQFEGCINLTISLLKSESSSTREAAAGLLRSISSVNLYRDMVAESGAVEEIIGLLSHPSLTPEAKEHCLCTLWNLSVDEKLRVKIANSDILRVLIKSLEDEYIRVKEAAGGVLANLALTHSNHNIMVEAGVIPKLAKFLQLDVDNEYQNPSTVTGSSGAQGKAEDNEPEKWSSTCPNPMDSRSFIPQASTYIDNVDKILRKEARNALVELAKNEYYRILIIEEGLVPVPLVGSAAYKSFRPELYSLPRFPDDTRIEGASERSSRFGAEVLAGFHNDKNSDIEEGKKKAMVGWSRQRFLARYGKVEVENAKLSQTESSISQQFTILPWVDGVARLVLILELEDESAIARAAKSIADASINEHMRTSFKEAGAVIRLVRLLDHKNDSIKFAVIDALERLSISHVVCQIIETHGVMPPLINVLKSSYTSENMMEKALDLLARIMDPSKEMKSKIFYGPVDGFKNDLEASSSHSPLSVDVKFTEMSVSEKKDRHVMDSVVIARLVKMLKHSSPSLQRKAASILESESIFDANVDTIISENIESGLDAVFQQRVLSETESDVEGQQPELHALQAEEAGLAISAASRLLTKLLDSEKFRSSINHNHFTQLLRDALKSKIPLHYKDWVAACLVKLSSLYGPPLEPENTINMEVTLHETIPRLIQQIGFSYSLEAQEAAVLELNRIISEGVADATRTVASKGGIFPLVKLIGEGTERAVEAALSILYNLSMDEENHSAIVAAGAVPVLKRIILSQRPPWKIALHLLRTLPT